MANVKFVPKCLDENHELTGELTIKAPTFTERLKYIEEAKIQFGATTGEADLMSNNVHSMRVLVERAKEHVVAVDLKAKDGSGEIKSYDEMLDDNRCDGILTELGLVLMQGFRPSKNSKPL